jgi:uncharacterized protein YyaL (SSP411 family)
LLFDIEKKFQYFIILIEKTYSRRRVRSGGYYMGSCNHLAGQKSPYLIQHSGNPVDWYPWSDEAFDRARLEDKPVFLSIGYSTCHWCHVMEKESFEDAVVARLLNEFFISVKVDREERPDIDKVYMTACQMMTGSGGWPLSIIMTPDKKPFFAATYIPRETVYGRIGIIELIEKIASLWKGRRDELNSSAENAYNLLRELGMPARGGAVDGDVAFRAFEHLKGIYDPVYGGFGGAPKFPSPHTIIFLLRYWEDGGGDAAGDMALETLRRIRLGGIYDQVGLGVHRYSTDAEWLLPHFEKMLYDQAMLALAYAEAYQVTGDAFYSMAAGEICEYVLRDMTSPEGGFYSAEDADSEGREGEYYIWSVDEIIDALGKEDAESAIRTYNMERPGNFFEGARGEDSGKNILYLAGMPADMAAYNAIRRKLFHAREKRVRPLKDDKILTDWNGLMIAALAKCAWLLDDGRYYQAANKAAGFISSVMSRRGDRLLHRYRGGESSVQGNLDDYAFMAWGLIELYECAFMPEHLDLAVRISESMLAHFSGGDGRLFFTPGDGEELITRTAESADGAAPSGSSVAFYNMMRLGRLTGNAVWEERANSIVRGASEMIRRYPHAHTMLLAGVQYAQRRSCEVVLAGSSDDPVLKDMIRALRGYMSRCAVLVKFSDKPSGLIDALAPFAREISPLDGRPAAHVCRGNRCFNPVKTVHEMIELIKST